MKIQEREQRICTELIKNHQKTIQQIENPRKEIANPYGTHEKTHQKTIQKLKIQETKQHYCMELLQHNQKNLLCVVYCILCIKMTPEGWAPILPTVKKMYPGGSNPCNCHKSDPAPNLLFLLCKN